MVQRHEIPPGLANQATLAATLGLTAARISQLVQQGIFAVDDDGLLQIEECAERHRLFRSSEWTPAWESFAQRLEESASRLQPDLNRLTRREISDPIEFQTIAHEVHSALSDLRFVIAASRDAESTLMLFDFWADSLRASMVGAVVQLLADANNVSWDQALADLRTDAMRGTGEVKEPAPKGKGKSPQPKSKKGRPAR